MVMDKKFQTFGKCCLSTFMFIVDWTLKYICAHSALFYIPMFNNINTIIPVFNNISTAGALVVITV